MYNLSLPKLCATLLAGLLSKSSTSRLTATDRVTSQSDLALYCAVLYIVACVDVSGTVFRDRSWL